MRNWKEILIVSVIPTISFVVGIYTIGHYGINWDEPYHYRRGQALLHYILTGKKNYNDLPPYKGLKGDSDHPNFRNGQEYFKNNQKKDIDQNIITKRSFYQDDSWNGEFFIDMETTYGHPPLNGILSALSNKIFYQKLGIMGDLESYRFFIICTVSLSVFVIAFFMWKEFGIYESVITSLSLSTYPLLAGEQHFNIKDPVETSYYALTVIFAYLGLKKNNFLWLILSVFVFSFGLATKFNIVFVVFPILIWFTFHLFIKKMKFRNLLKSGIIKKIIILIFVGPIISIGTLIMSYPTIWNDPVSGLYQILSFYLGVGYPNTIFPGYSYFGFVNTFPITWIIYTTPPILILLFLTSTVIFKKLKMKNDFIILLMTWFLITIARNSLFGALTYGGVRIIMEYVPALAMISGISAGFIIKVSSKKNFRLIISSLIILGFLPSIYKLFTIHPNENVYFNIIAGGLSGAKDKNLPYWGDSYGNAYFQGVTWLNKYSEINSRVSTPIGNTSNIPRFKLRDDIALSPYYWSGLKHEGEYLIELTYNNKPMDWFVLRYLNEAMIPVHEIKVDGVAIAKVWKNDPFYIKEKYKNTELIETKFVINQNENYITIELPRIEKLMEITVYQETDNCDPLRTGYASLSKDGTIWERETEDIARDQLNRQEIKKLETIYKYYFMEKQTKYIRFYADSESNCILRAYKTTATVLK